MISPEGIYIHIPFCSSKCSYCNFYSLAKPSSSVIHNYTISLCNKITRKVQEYSGFLNKISSVYFGGGTPNLLPIDELAAITSHLENTFGFKLSDLPEVTIEINPGLVDFTYLKELRSLGFNRISIGTQSLDNNLLKLMGRIHSREDIFKTLEDSLSAGFSNISTDLIFNYPTQTSDQVIADIRRLAKFPITHFSVYSLNVEPKTRLHRQIENKKLILNNEDLERETYYRINETLADLGFRHYEISNYALPGYESRQNNLYWSQGRYFGFGPAASSFLKNTRIDNPPDLKAYLRGDPIPDENIFQLTKKELKEEFMFLGLRKLTGIDDRDYRKLYNSSFFEDFKKPIKKLIDENYLIREENKIKLTPLGIDFADRVSLEFLL